MFLGRRGVKLESGSQLLSQSRAAAHVLIPAGRR